MGLILLRRDASRTLRFEVDFRRITPGRVGGGGPDPAGFSFRACLRRGVYSSL